jgi:hypothetical protein
VDIHAGSQEGVAKLHSCFAFAERLGDGGGSYRPHRWHALPRAHRFHPSLRSCCTAMLAGLRTLIQARHGAGSIGVSTFFDTMPPAPCAKTTGPSSAMCSLNRMPASVLRNSRAIAALRSRNGRLRRSSPSCSMRSKASVAGATPILGRHQRRLMSPIMRGKDMAFL